MPQLPAGAAWILGAAHDATIDRNARQERHLMTPLYISMSDAPGVFSLTRDTFYRASPPLAL